MAKNMQTEAEQLSELKRLLAPCVIHRGGAKIVSSGGLELSWLFDFKQVLLRSDVLDLVSTILWERIKKIPDPQIGGLETTAIGIIAGIIMKAKQHGTSLHGFYVRKSRKKDGLQHMIEGPVGDEPIILADDILNSGKSMVRQIEVLELMGKKVHTVCAILRFRNESYYRYFREKGIRVISLLTLDDFSGIDSVAEYTAAQKRHSTPVANMPFLTRWKFASDDPSYSLVLPKSAPVIDDARVYFGADNGTFWALNQSDGSVAWQYRTLFGAGGKRILSSPALHNNIVYFGSYDGNFYALDTETGKKRWIYREADWVGSSPCVAEDLRLVFIGLEFGLVGKQGGIAALNAETGEKQWWQPIPTLVHSSPSYSKKHGVVVVGSSAGVVYGLRAQTGDLLWEFETGAPVRASFALDESRGLVCFGSEDYSIYVLDVRSGTLIHKIETMEPLYSNPLVENGKLYMGCLDKRMLCIDLESGNIDWKFWTAGRIFASPIVEEGHIFIGSNDGRLYELDPLDGREYGFFQATERIVNKAAYNPRTKRFFVPTFANEIYCLERKEGASAKS